MRRQRLERVIDANANRAAEGLRVLEDIARFLFDDAALSESLKQQRHQLRQQIPAGVTSQRDTVHDVGTSISTDSEAQRGRLTDLISANAKRAQEALRVLEESCKLGGTQSAAIEQLRYAVYTIEARLLQHVPATRLLREKIYVLLDHDLCVDPISCARQLVAAGAGIIQYRGKSLCENEYFKMARQLRAVIDQRCLFIVNDFVAVAAAVAADGVHLGQDDVSPELARAALGPQAVIGVSTHSLAQIQAAHQEPIDYIGIGPMYATATKSHEAVQGPALLEAAVADISLPSYAIGGLNSGRITALKEHIPHGVAVAGCICTAENPAAIYHELASIFTD